MTAQSNASTSVVIDVPLVAQLVATQFPQWAHLPIKAVQTSGWDNRTFHLGADTDQPMVVRLPSHAAYEPQISKEWRWLPYLAPLLPLAIPQPVARGLPTASYPFDWSIYRWIEGESSAASPPLDSALFASALAQFLVALHQIDPSNGPPPGEHNFYRGGSLAVYASAAEHAITALQGKINTTQATDLLNRAVASSWTRPSVWVHGDISPGNLIMHDGQLTAVIDFGTLGVGDPACDLAISWTMLSGTSRHTFRTVLEPYIDADTWVRAKGWVLWKALIIAARHAQTNAVEYAQPLLLVDSLLDED